MPEGNWAKTSIADANKFFQGGMEGHLQGQDKIWWCPNPRQEDWGSPHLVYQQ